MLYFNLTEITAIYILKIFSILFFDPYLALICCIYLPQLSLHSQGWFHFRRRCCLISLQYQQLVHVSYDSDLKFHKHLNTLQR